MASKGKSTKQQKRLEKQHPVAKVNPKKEKVIHTLDSGVRVKFHPVSQFDVQAIASSVEEPEVPIFHDEETGEDIENPSDPKYKAAVEEANLKRGIMVIEALLLGVELVDGLPPPEENNWKKELTFKAKRGLVDLDGLDLEDDFELAFAYKKHIAFVSVDDYDLLRQEVEGMSGAAGTANNLFPGDEERNSDSGPSAEAGSEGESS